MKVLYDYQAFTMQSYGGISRYYCELITSINKTNDQALLSLLYSNNKHLNEYNIFSRPNYYPNKHRLLRYANQLNTTIDVISKEFDIYHATYYDPFFLNVLRRKPYTVTFYDMIHEKFSDKYPQLALEKNTIYNKKKISERATNIIAISESTKRDMVDILNVSPERINVTYLSSSLAKMYAIYSRKEQSEEPYLLYVGNRNMYKNFLPYLLAVADILKKYDIKLICAGGGAFTLEEQEVVRKYKLQNFVKQYTVNDEKLSRLYAEAVAYVLPSLYEGFGIPIIEAMSFGCPCLLSSFSSMPEIGADAAAYFYPDNTDAVQSSLINLLDNKQLRDHLSMQGKLRSESFSTEKTKEQTMSVYKQLL